MMPFLLFSFSQPSDMVRVSCDQCSQSFNTKKLFVSHLISKSCHKSIREAAKSQTRNKGQQEEAFDYPTLEIVPFQNCSECRWFSKPGMQMYMYIARVWQEGQDTILACRCTCSPT